MNGEDDERDDARELDSGEEEEEEEEEVISSPYKGRPKSSSEKREKYTNHPTKRKSRTEQKVSASIRSPTPAPTPAALPAKVHTALSAANPQPASPPSPPRPPQTSLRSPTASAQTRPGNHRSGHDISRVGGSQRMMHPRHVLTLSIWIGMWIRGEEDTSGEARLCECVRIPEAVFEGICIALPAVSTEAFGNKADGLEVERGADGEGGRCGGVARLQDKG